MYAGMFAYFVSVLRNFARFLQGARLKYVITRCDPAASVTPPLLQKKHPEAWKNMGSPTLFMNSSIRSTFQQIRFVHGAISRKLEDGRLSTLCWTIRIFDYAYAVVFLALIGVTFAR